MVGSLWEWAVSAADNINIYDVQIHNLGKFSKIEFCLLMHLYLQILHDIVPRTISGER